MQADVGLWPVRMVAADNDLDLAQHKIDARSPHRAARFSRASASTPTATELQGFEVADTRANPYQASPRAIRFIITTTLMVRTGDPARSATPASASRDLVAAGVVLSSGGPGYGGPTYLFTRLNDLKPEMVAEATANARKAAGRVRAAVGAVAWAASGARRRACSRSCRAMPAPGIDAGSADPEDAARGRDVEYQLK